MSCSIQKLCQDSSETIDPYLEIENNCVAFFKDVLNKFIRLKGVINQNKITEEPDFTKIKRKFDKLNTIHFDIIPVEDIPTKVFLNFDFKNFFIITRKGIMCIVNTSGQNFFENSRYISINKESRECDCNNVTIKFKHW
jgi:hypothetical protein